MPMHAALGVRYEKTEVTSSALVPIATGINWVANNEFSVVFCGAGLHDARRRVRLRAAERRLRLRRARRHESALPYGESIGRPGWGDIQGGQTLNQLARINGGTGQQGNPGLKPLESQNYDLSFEWYYNEGSYLSVGYFRKDIDNYVGVTTITETPFDLPHPGQGAYFDEAVAERLSGGGSDLHSQLHLRQSRR